MPNRSISSHRPVLDVIRKQSELMIFTCTVQQRVENEENEKAAGSRASLEFPESRTIERYINVTVYIVKFLARKTGFLFARSPFASTVPSLSGCF